MSTVLCLVCLIIFVLALDHAWPSRGVRGRRADRGGQARAQEGEASDRAREEAVRARYAAFGRAWERWMSLPRGPQDDRRIVTAQRVWGAPPSGARFPRRFYASQLGKVKLEGVEYRRMQEAPVDVADPRRGLAPASWARRRLDVWALHSRAARSAQLMRVWLDDERALVEMHRGRSVLVDEILPGEVVGFVRGFTRLGPRSGPVDGLRWLPAEVMPLGERALAGTFQALRDVSVVAPAGSAIGGAVRGGDFHALAFVCWNAESGWRRSVGELRVLDAGGATYQVGDALAGGVDDDRWAPPTDAGGVGLDEAGAGDRELGLVSGVGGELREMPVNPSDLAVVPIDPKVVLWAVGRMIES